MKSTNKEQIETNTRKPKERRIEKSLKTIRARMKNGFNGMFKDFGSKFLTKRHLKLIFSSIIVGLLVGLGTAAFLYLIKFFSDILLNYPTSIYAPLIILMPAAGGLIVGVITYKISPESEGHGVSEVLESMALHGGRIRARVPLIKMITSAITIGSGGSAGYEGPMVHIGGGTGSTIGRLLKMDEAAVKILVVCGAAAGISAIFNAPLGGVFFGLEIVYGGVEAIALIPVVLSSFVSTAVAQGILGAEPLLKLRVFAILNPYEYLLFFALGVIFGLMSIFWIKIFHYISDRFQKLKAPKYIKPGIGGLMLGFIIFFFPQIIGGGYEVINRELVVPISLVLLLTLGLLKIIGTSITLGSGGSGGAFAPMLFIGAMFGGAYGLSLQWLLFSNTYGSLTPILPYLASLMGSWVRYLSPAIAFEPMAYALVGMAALIAAAARAPLTGIVLVTEISKDYSMILPLMLACITAYLVSRLIMRGDLYTENLLKKGIDLVEERRADLLDRVRVGDVMSKPMVVSSDMKVFQVLEMICKYHHHGYPVVDNDNLIGIIDSDTVDREMAENHEMRRVGEIVNKNVVTVFPDETLHQALDKMLENKTDRLVVVDRKNKNIVGIITRTDILEVHEIKLIMKYGKGAIRDKLQKIARIDEEYREEMEI